MKCPRCRLINPESALRCDCGYDFPTGTIKDSYITPSGKTRSRLAYIGIALLVGVFGAHNFYAERNRAGRIQAASTITILVLLLIFAAFTKVPAVGYPLIYTATGLYAALCIWITGELFLVNKDGHGRKMPWLG